MYVSSRSWLLYTWAIVCLLLKKKHMNAIMCSPVIINYIKGFLSRLGENNMIYVRQFSRYASERVDTGTHWKQISRMQPPYTTDLVCCIVFAGVSVDEVRVFSADMMPLPLTGWCETRNSQEYIYRQILDQSQIASRRLSVEKWLYDRKIYIIHDAVTYTRVVFEFSRIMFYWLLYLTFSQAGNKEWF